MVLTNPLLTGLVLLLLACIPSCLLEVQEEQSQLAGITTTSARSTDITDSQNVIGTTRKFHATTSKPKTDVSNDKIAEQRNSRGSTKYADYTTTEPAKSTISERDDDKNDRATTVRNDRSLNVDADKYNSADVKFHNENNIYSETQTGEKKYGGLNEEKYTTHKPWNEAGFAEFRAELTTPRYDTFDGKHRKMQEEISKAIDKEMDDVISKSPAELTTPSYDTYSKYRMEEKVSKTVGLTTNTYKEITEEVSKSPAVELTTPTNDLFDGHYKKIQEDISKSLDDSIDKFFDGKKDLREEGNGEKPQTNNSKLDYVRYRNMEAIESKIKNKIHKDYNTETGLRMKVTSNYNNSQVVDAPGIVINTIPGQKDLETSKKTDLDNGETKLEKITIEKPEKDPGIFINNKIENEFNSIRTEGPEERPFEHRGMFLSKRGSTVDNGEIVQKTVSTESVVPLDLYPVKASSILDVDRMSYSLNDVQNTTSIPKNVRKEKNKTVKKELENPSSDLDNKIPKFLMPVSTSKYNSVEATTVGSSTVKIVLQNVSVELTTPFVLESTTETTLVDENATTEYFGTDMTMDTSEYFDVTDASTSDTITEETTMYTEMTTDITDENLEDGAKVLTSATTEPQTITTANFPGQYSESTNETTPYHQLSTTERSDITWKSTTVSENVNETVSPTTEPSYKSVLPKKNDTVSNVINEITKPPNLTTAPALNETPTTKKSDAVTENIKENVTKPYADIDQTKHNEINVNGDKIVSDECENEETDDYGENNCKTHNVEETGGEDGELEDNNGPSQRSAVPENKNAITGSVTSTLTVNSSSTTSTMTEKTFVTTTPVIVTTVTATSTTQKNREVTTTEENLEATTKSDSIVSPEDEEDGGNGGKIAAIVISTIGGICLLLLVTLLVIMKKRQKRFNYGQRCRPVSLDAYSMDNVSIHNSTRRKGVLMMSKRSYGNPAFEDPTSPTHLLNFSELLKFVNNQDGIKTEFDRIPQVTTKTNELPEGCDIKNRYANIIPLPETRVYLNIVDGIPSSDYINANYVTGPQGARNYYIASQAPMTNTIEDFWRMIWEQQSKVVLMLTHLYENGIEKCIDYLPPSEVLDCHRLFGDYQVTLKKREVKDKYIISSLQLKNMVSNSWREVTHLWYMGWPEKGVPDEANSLIAFLIEARSCIKMGDNKIKETNNTSISNGSMPNLNPVVVHCSPGTGRTGTVIACDIAVREFELTRKVDIARIVYRIRRDRASAVQTKEQYAFIYKVINFYATKLTGGVFDSF